MRSANHGNFDDVCETSFAGDHVAPHDALEIGSGLVAIAFTALPLKHCLWSIFTDNALSFQSKGVQKCRTPFGVALGLKN